MDRPGAGRHGSSTIGGCGRSPRRSARSGPLLHGAGLFTSLNAHTGGEKVNPEEIEEALKEHPAVYDAVVVGVSAGARR